MRNGQLEKMSLKELSRLRLRSKTAIDEKRVTERARDALEDGRNGAGFGLQRG